LKLETGNWELVTGNWKLVTGNWDVEGAEAAESRRGRGRRERISKGRHGETERGRRTILNTQDFSFW
jgi:hypothetical protein